MDILGTILERLHTRFYTIFSKRDPPNKEANLASSEYYVGMHSVIPLVQHIRTNNLSKIKDNIILNGLSPDGTIVHGKNFPMLSFATSLDKKDVVNLLLTYKADPNMQDDFGITPLMRAAMLNRKDIAKILLENGARSDLIDNDGRTAFDYAILFDNLGVGELLKNTGDPSDSMSDDLMYD